MKRTLFFKTILSALLFLVAAALNGCNDDKDNSWKEPDPDPIPAAAYLRVTPETLTFDAHGAAIGSDGKFVVESNYTWEVSVEAGKDWVHLSATSGDKDGTITVTIPEPEATGGEADVTFTTTNPTGEKATKTVHIIQNSVPTPEPPVPAGKLTITADFQLGTTVTTPELPPYTTENFTTGRHEYTIDGYKFAIFVDAAENGKFYWIDNTQFFAAPEPNKGLFFSKLGAYVEFPAIAGKVLTSASYLPTTSQNDVALDLLDTNSADVDYVLDFDDNGASVYTLINPVVNTGYRIEITNKKNAQCARLVLIYNDAE